MQRWQSGPHHFTDSNPETLRLRAWHRVISKLATRACGEARAGPSFLPSRLVALLSQRGLTVHLCHLACLLVGFHGSLSGPLMTAVQAGHQGSPDHHCRLPGPLQQLPPPLQMARSYVNSSSQWKASLPKDTCKLRLKALPFSPPPPFCSPSFWLQTALKLP